MRAVAAYQVKVPKFEIKFLADHSSVACIVAVMHRESDGLPRHESIPNAISLYESKPLQFECRERDKLFIGHHPKGLLLRAEVFETVGDTSGGRLRAVRKRLQLLNSGNFYMGFRDVNPAISK